MRAFQLLVAVTIAFTVGVGCAPKKKSKSYIVTPRTERGGAEAAQAQDGSSVAYDGSITSNWSAVNILTLPQLADSGAEYQLGNLTSVRFGGHVEATSSGGVVSSSARLSIQIKDSKVDKVGPILIDINPDVRGFGVSGKITGTSAEIIFEDEAGSFYFKGQVGANFTGTVSFTNSETNGSWETLGSFSIPSCKFFKCY